MGTIPVTWVSGNYSGSTSTIINGEPRPPTAVAREQAFSQFVANATGVQNGITTYERKQPLNEVFGSGGSTYPIIATAPGANTSTFSSSGISFTPSSFPVRTFDTQYIPGTITFPDNFPFDVGIVVNGSWSTAARCLMSLGIDELTRSGSFYNFTFGSDGSSEAGYSSTLTFSQGGTNRSVSGSPDPRSLGRSLYYLTIDYAGQVTSQPITVTANDSYGRSSQVLTIVLQPIPRVTFTPDSGDDHLIYVDASQSFSPSSGIAAYSWTQPVEAGFDSSGAEVPGSVISTYVSSTPRARLRIPEMEGNNDEYASRDIIMSPLAIVPSSGGYSASRNFVLRKTSQTLGVILMPDSVRIRASQSGANVLIYRYGKDTAIAPTIATLAGLSRPRLSARNGILALFARNNSSRVYELRESKDGGKTWL